MLAMTTFITACSDIDENFSGGAGFVNLELAVNPEVICFGQGGEGGYTVTPPAIDEFSITLSDLSGQYSHTWQSPSLITPSEQYRSGVYTVTAQYGSLENEGFDTPCFMGTAEVVVKDAEVARPTVVCSIANTLVSLSYSDRFKDFVDDYSAVLHSGGGVYVEVPAGETRPVFLRPGDVSLTLSLSLGNDVDVTFSPATISNAKERHLYTIAIDVEDTATAQPRLLIDIYDEEIKHSLTVSLSHDLLSMPAPVVQPVGFDPSVPLILNEGEIPSSKIAMEVSSQNELSQVKLTTISPTLLSLGWPPEIDLLNVDQSVIDRLREVGLKVDGLREKGSKNGVVDFTEVVSRLTNGKAAIPEASFTLVAKDILTKVNDPVNLDIDIEPVDLTVKEVSSAVMGIDKAMITVTAPSVDLRKNIQVQALDNRTWENLTVDDVIPADQPSTYNVIVTVPQGATSVKARILYCNRLKGEFTIDRKAPEYKVDVDAFATRARLRVTADDPAVVELVTRYLRVFIDSNQASVLDRDDKNGLLTILGLSPSSTYRLKTTLLDNPSPSDFSRETVFVTEGTPSLPNADFEEIKETIKVNNLLSGGRYSQNTVEIYNRQNTVSFKLSVPTKGWANTNDKTFCKDATNRNTWYMQPSVYSVSEAKSGGYAVTLRSVAFDVSGEIIPDYLQTSQPFTNYSMNIPYIEARAAGKLFLGEYGFDPLSMSERYIEGISFKGRPMSVNGFYIFLPCKTYASDRGLVDVEVIGNDGLNEIVIASGRLALPLASSYTSFSVPLTYNKFGIKASKIKIMFASTEQAGSLAQERTSVITCDDPVTSSSIGSVLTVDNLSLSY